MSDGSPAAKGSDRVRRILAGPIAPMLARLAGPNIAVASAQTATTIADAWFVGRVGVSALASLALVFPIQAMMQMMSAGAMGGGISSAVARALGAGDRPRANALVWHALLIALGMATLYVVVFAALAAPVFSALGGHGEALDGAVAYAQIAFGGALAIWLANSLASLLRGSGDMALPARVLIVTSIGQIALSGALTLGWGPLPALGVRGPAVALVSAFAVAAIAMAIAVARNRHGATFARATLGFQRALFVDIAKVGAVACGNALLTILTIVIVTGIVAGYGTAALAGYGLGSRLELILIPIAFGVGGAMTASVGANFGARQYARARRIAWTGGTFVFAVTGALGLAVAAWPGLWLDWLTADAAARAYGAAYLHIAGPFYGFFGMGMALYFASQGTGNMIWPFSAGVVRMAVAAGGGAIAALALGAPLATVYWLVAAGLLLFGTLIAASLRSRVWSPDRHQ